MVGRELESASRDTWAMWFEESANDGVADTSWGLSIVYSANTAANISFHRRGRGVTKSSGSCLCDRASQSWTGCVEGLRAHCQFLRMQGNPILKQAITRQYSTSATTSVGQQVYETTAPFDIRSSETCAIPTTYQLSTIQSSKTHSTQSNTAREAHPQHQPPLTTATAPKLCEGSKPIHIGVIPTITPLLLAAT